LLEYFAYHAGIMLDALACLLCLKLLCWHNRCKPSLDETWAVLQPCKPIIEPLVHCTKSEQIGRKVNQMEVHHWNTSQLNITYTNFSHLQYSLMPYSITLQGIPKILEKTLIEPKQRGLLMDQFYRATYSNELWV